MHRYGVLSAHYERIRLAFLTIDLSLAFGTVLELENMCFFGVQSSKERVVQRSLGFAYIDLQEMIVKFQTY